MTTDDLVNDRRSDEEYAAALTALAAALIKTMVKARRSYGPSWVRRGGPGAYLIGIRKIDRLEEQVKKHGYDIFAAIAADQRKEGITDDLGDFAAYVFLWLDAAQRLGIWPGFLDKDAAPGVFTCDRCQQDTDRLTEIVSGDYLCPACLAAADVYVERSRGATK